MILLVILNTINLIAGSYLFLVTTSILVNHDIIKKFSNKVKKTDKTKPEITDWDIRFVGAFFAFLTMYFFWNFGHMMWFGNRII